MNDFLYQEFKNNDLFKKYEKNAKIQPMPVQSKEKDKKLSDFQFRQNLEMLNNLTKSKMKPNKNFINDFKRMSNRKKALFLYAILDRRDY